VQFRRAQQTEMLRHATITIAAVVGITHKLATLPDGLDPTMARQAGSISTVKRLIRSKS